MCAKDTVREFLLIMGRIVFAKTGEKPTSDKLAELNHDVSRDLQLFFEKGQATDYRKKWDIDYNTHAKLRAVAKSSRELGEWPEVEAELARLFKDTNVA
jgi:hypothetical protein